MVPRLSSHQSRAILHKWWMYEEQPRRRGSVMRSSTMSPRFKGGGPTIWVDR